MAFLVVLESMTPAERVALILHDVFRYSFTEVAQITGRTPAACRQLASSARRRIRASQLPATPTAGQAGLVRDFKQAWEAKDINALISLLDPNATVIADGGGLALAALRPIEGGEQIARYIVDLAARAPGNVTILERTVNGQPGLVAQQERRHRDGVRVRRHGRTDQAHLGRAQPRQAPALDDPLTLTCLPSAPNPRSPHPPRPGRRRPPHRWSIGPHQTGPTFHRVGRSRSGGTRLCPFYAY